MKNKNGIWPQKQTYIISNILISTTDIENWCGKESRIKNEILIEIQRNDINKTFSTAQNK